MYLITNLNFTWQCEEAFQFYAHCLGAELGEINRYGEMPSDPEHPLDPKYLDQIMHISVVKNGQAILMGADLIPMMMQDKKFTVGNNMGICIVADSRLEADTMFDALAVWGTVTLPMEDQFWGDYFGSCDDKYWIDWMISYTDPKSSEAK